MPLGRSYRQVVQGGGDHPTLDRLERVVHAPGRKLRQWFGEPYDPKREKDNRKKALEVSIQHLADNDLHDVYVEYRRYRSRKRHLAANQSLDRTRQADLVISSSPSDWSDR